MKIEKCSQSLVMAYPEDLEDHLSEELIQFSAHLKTDLGACMDKKMNKEVQMYKLIKENGLESAYPNVNIVLRIYLSLMVTNCSGERSFSKSKCVKCQQRTSLGQDKLNYLTLLSIKHELLNEIEVKDIIKKFASRRQENDLCKLKSHATSCSQNQFFFTCAI